MKNKQNKNQDGKSKTETRNENQRKHAMAAELWWNSRSPNQKMLAFTLAGLIEEMNERRCMQIRQKGDKILLAWAETKAGGVISAEVMSFHHPKAEAQAPEDEGSDEWFAKLPDEDKQLALGVSKMVFGDPEKWRWS